MKNITPFLLSIVSTVTFSSAVQAFDFVFDLNYQSGANPGSSGTLSFSFDYSALEPIRCQGYGGTYDCSQPDAFGEEINLNGLEYVSDFSITLTGLDSLPDTSFTKDDLTEFSIIIDRVANWITLPSWTGTSFNIPKGPATINFFNGTTTQYEVKPLFDIPIPEPLTILGAGTAVAFGSFFKRKLNKK